MDARTHNIFAVLGSQKRLRILLEVLDRGECPAGELASILGLKQPDVSQCLTALAREGLLARGNQRTPYTVVRPREVRWLLRAAALLEYESTGRADALALAKRMRREAMARGADEPLPADELRIGTSP